MSNPAANDTPKASLLIVDDIPANIDLLLETLKASYACRAATNGEIALKIANSDNPPDLILLDIQMPGMDGYEVCTKLKANEATRDIPVIFVTALSETGDETRGFEVGAVDYITKPITPVVVQSRVKAHLDLRQAQKTVQQQHEAILSDLKIAQRVQQGLIPDSPVDSSGLDVAFVYEPASQIGGDILDIEKCPDGRMIFFLADAMGHGIQAALVMTAAALSFRSAIAQSTEPVRILSYINSQMMELFQGRFVTAVCLDLDTNGQGTLAIAGHSCPYHRKAADSSVEQGMASSYPLGVVADAAPFCMPISLAPGDLLVLCTDGVTEMSDPEHNQFGDEGVKTVLESAGILSAKQAIDSILKSLEKHLNDSARQDDVAILAIRQPISSKE